MSVTVRIPTPLRALTAEQDVVSAGGENLAAVIDDLDGSYPGFRERVLDDTGEIRRFVNVFVNGEDVRFLDGLHTAVANGDEVSIVPAMAGGGDGTDS